MFSKIMDPITTLLETNMNVDNNTPTDTIDVAQLVDIVNHYLKDTPASQAGARMGMMIILDRVLTDNHLYKGFRFLTKDEVKDGVPGIRYLDGNPHPDFIARFANTDATRVHYFGGNQ